MAKRVGFMPVSARALDFEASLDFAHVCFLATLH
jgi:hypothetical protein